MARKRRRERAGMTALVAVTLVTICTLALIVLIRKIKTPEITENVNTPDETDLSYVNQMENTAEAPVMQALSEDEAGPSYAAEPSEPERALPSEVGIDEECFRQIEAVIEEDVANGFPGAQLAVMKDGRLVYENAWGQLNAYEPDGTRIEDGIKATTDTMYDLASVTKMFGVNYALQKLVSDGEIDLDSRVVSYLGDRFSEDVIEIRYEGGDDADIQTQKEWKAALTLKDLLMHQAGFPEDPRYCNPHLDTEKQKYDPDKTNLLYAGCGGDESTREATVEAICRTPLLYEPGSRTLYSDVDYMILGLVVEQVTGEDLDTYLKETFLEPMGLKRISYRPLDRGYTKEDCAATELNGNTRDGSVSFDGIRTYTLQGEVHDEKAYYSMGGISGNAGLFGNATDLARLANVMLTGEYEGGVFFSKDVIDMFTAPKSEEKQNWGLGWWRQGHMQRAKYFSTKAGENTFGHQGWTGTLVMIDPDEKLVIAFLTNKINTPVKDPVTKEFMGNDYTTATLGFVPELIYKGMK